MNDGANGANPDMLLLAIGDCDLGTHCELNVDDCASNPCKNGGQCVDGVAEYECRCLPGFQGLRCEIDTDECQSAPCHNNGTCVEHVNSFTLVV